MNYFELIETKRKHVVKYKDKIPPKQLIESSLWKAWKTTPSKHNAMPYQVFVWGPEKILEKEAIHRLCVKSHKRAEDRAIEKNLATVTQGGFENPYYEHIKNNPYLITIHSRVAKPNRFYKEQIKKGHFYDQGHEIYTNFISGGVSIEVGIFAANLTNYLLESEIDVSYNNTFKRNVNEWHEVGLSYINNIPLLMISCGYAEKYRWQELKSSGKESWDIKPESNEIIKWI